MVCPAGCLSYIVHDDIAAQEQRNFVHAGAVTCYLALTTRPRFP